MCLFSGITQYIYIIVNKNRALNQQMWSCDLLKRSYFGTLSKLINLSEPEFVHFGRQYAKWLKASILEPDYLGQNPSSTTYSSLCLSFPHCKMGLRLVPTVL